MLDLSLICNIYADLQVAESRIFHDNFIDKLDKFIDRVNSFENGKYFAKILKLDDKLKREVLSPLEGFLKHKDISEEQKEAIKKLIFLIQD